ncbi:unnamed protein product, partial [Amoebophrya sp. A120]
KKLIFVEYFSGEEPSTVATKLRTWHMPMSSADVRGLKPGKFVARFQLLSSRTFRTAVVPASQRTIEDDIRAKKTGQILSDGGGRISIGQMARVQAHLESTCGIYFEPGSW